MGTNCIYGHDIPGAAAAKSKTPGKKTPSPSRAGNTPRPTGLLAMALPVIASLLSQPSDAFSVMPRGITHISPTFEEPRGSSGGGVQPNSSEVPVSTSSVPPKPDEEPRGSSKPIHNQLTHSLLTLTVKFVQESKHKIKDVPLSLKEKKLRESDWNPRALNP